MKRGTPDHPKVYELCELLGCDRPTAIGYLEMLWHFTAKYAPQGNIGRFSNARIEAALDWFGRGKRQGKLLECLEKARWIDKNGQGSYEVHDWKDHADETVRVKLKRAGLSFCGTYEESVGTNSRHVSESFPRPSRGKNRLPEPTPEPEPTPSPEPAAAAVRAACENSSRSTANGSNPAPEDIEIVRAELHFYATKMCHLSWDPPDYDICSKVLETVRGDIAELRQKLRELWIRKAKPSQSYGWFPAVLKEN